ncbi:hypothetical protein OY671_011943, partial [Metschnikowia pulcherrima]
KVKADRSPARPSSRPARAGSVSIILAAGGYASAKYNGSLPWDAPKPAQAAAAPATAAPAPEGPASRIVRVSPANPRIIDQVRSTTAESSDPDFASFDPASSTLSAPRRSLNEIERPSSSAEVVNRSDKYVASSPGMDISVFDGSRPSRSRQEWSSP